MEDIENQLYEILRKYYPTHRIKIYWTKNQYTGKRHANIYILDFPEQDTPFICRKIRELNLDINYTVSGDYETELFLKQFRGFWHHD